MSYLLLSDDELLPVELINGHGPFSTAYFGGFGLWVRVKVLGSNCNNRFPNTFEP